MELVIMNLRMGKSMIGIGGREKKEEGGTHLELTTMTGMLSRSFSLSTGRLANDGSPLQKLPLMLLQRLDGDDVLKKLRRRSKGCSMANSLSVLNSTATKI
jgi:hypothetical protein